MHLRYVLSAAVILCLAGAAKADYTLEFATSGGSPTSTFMITGVGNSVTMQVYLVQTNTGTSNTLSTVGLEAGQVALNFSSANLSVSAITPNSSFAYYGTSSSAGVASVSDTNSTGILSGASDRILLGTFTFTATTGAGGLINTTFPSGGANDVNGSNVTLDSLVSQASASIYVVTVPEPGTMALTSLAGALIGFGAWRKRRKSLAAQVA